MFYKHHSSYFLIFALKHRFWVLVRTASLSKKNVYPCKPQFYSIKVGCKGVLITRTRFCDALTIYYFAFSDILCTIHSA